MGVEADFIAAREDQFDAILESEYALDEFGGVYAKGADPLSIVDLYSAITGTDFPCENRYGDVFEVLRIEDDGQRLLLRVPENVRAALATINFTNIDEIYGKWIETEGFQVTAWDERIAREFLEEIGKYTRHNLDKPLLMWIVV